jgi:NADH:ubiquinone oxidoreductase subunit E
MSCTPSKTDNREEVLAAARAALTTEIVALIDRCRASRHAESGLIRVLHAVQAHFGHLGARQLDAVAQLLQVPAAKVTGVATFYHYFRLHPRGKYVVNVCTGTACYVKGADRIAARFREELGIDFGQTTADGRFSLESTACVGTCGLAPVVMINDRVFPNVSPDRVPALLEEVVRG